MPGVYFIVVYETENTSERWTENLFTSLWRWTRVEVRHEFLQFNPFFVKPSYISDLGLFPTEKSYGIIDHTSTIEIENIWKSELESADVSGDTADASGDSAEIKEKLRK